MGTSLAFHKPVSRPMIFPIPKKDREDYRMELNNAIRSTYYVDGNRHIFDAIEEEGINIIDFDDTWHHDPYRLTLDEKAMAIDDDGFRYVYYGTDKGIVVIKETTNGVELDYPSVLQSIISDVFPGLMN